jgi:arylsulfatase A-like enzyme
MRKTLVLLAIFLLSVTCVVLGAIKINANPTQLESKKPNVVVIVADDLGYCDTGLYKCDEVPTPNINSIARDGVLFPVGYVASSVCAPSRAGLMTGRYPQRFGFEFNTGGPRRTNAEDLGLPTSEITLAQVMKEAGYTTGIVGKWHLGSTQKKQPLARGFDHFFGTFHGATLYQNNDTPGLTTIKVDEADEVANYPEKRLPAIGIYKDHELVEEKEYITEAFTREAINFIEEHKKKPFFLYLPYTAVHLPLQATEKYLKRFENVTNPLQKVYRAMTSALDDGVGAVLVKLKETGLEKNTFVIFLSDNGCPTYINACSNFPLKDGKFSYYEGGVRVPFAMKWPGQITPGSLYAQPIIALDILPTLAEAVGAKVPKDRVIDGVNLLPYLKGENTALPHEMLFWRSGHNIAVRDSKWKLWKSDNDISLFFDLPNDIGEKVNVASQYPEVVERLSKALSEWNRQLSPPLWSSVGSRKIQADGATIELTP